MQFNGLNNNEENFLLYWIFIFISISDSPFYSYCIHKKIYICVSSSFISFHLMFSRVAYAYNHQGVFIIIWFSRFDYHEAKQQTEEKKNIQLNVKWQEVGFLVFLNQQTGTWSSRIKRSLFALWGFLACSFLLYSFSLTLRFIYLHRHEENKVDLERLVCGLMFLTHFHGWAGFEYV